MTHEFALSPSAYRDLTAKWPKDRRELFEERSGIMMDGGLLQEDAEREAYRILMGLAD